MDERDLEYLRSAFSDLLDCDSDDPLQPIDPLTYRTPENDSTLHIAAFRGDMQAVRLLFDAGMDVSLQESWVTPL